MRVFAAVLLSMSLAASPLLAGNAGETGKEDTPAAVTTASSCARQTYGREAGSLGHRERMQDLRSLVEEQRAELEAQRAALKARATEDGSARGKVRRDAFGTGSCTAAPSATPAITSAAASSPTPSSAAGGPIGTPSTTKMAAMSPQGGEKESPLYFKIGAAEFYPLGFMDLMNFFRTSDTRDRHRDRLR